MSPFGYNQTVAQEYFPLTKQEALERGFHWKDTDIRTPQPQTFNIPDDIQKVPDSIVQFPLACEQCKKKFKIIPQELKFCRNKNLPLPRKCPDCRHLQRLASKNPRRLQERTCAKCEKKILTANNSNYLVYCQACFSASLDTTDSHALV
ncbi:hypothetical protein HY605_01070 [Candidatus Peregrinibacteria bacterium]|nr:hypothetical protein [Candidatus Peregrinibacteria bacterium]